MTTDNLTNANAQGAESSNKGIELDDYITDFYCDYIDELCGWLDDEDVNWKEKVDRILEECKKDKGLKLDEGLKLISNETMFTPIKDLFDVKSICDKSDYRDYETDAVMNSFCVQRLRFDTSYSPRFDTFSAVIYILEDGRFFIHHNYKDKELLDNTIGCDFISDYITDEYSDMLWFLLLSKKYIDEISSGIESISEFISPYEDDFDIVTRDNEIHFCDQHIELKFKKAPKIDSLIEIADAIYKMKGRYESENRGKN